MTGALWSLFLLANFISLAVSFSTSGNKILDANGNQVVIRGVARPSLEWNSKGQYLSYDDYAKMKAWGANNVRLSLNQCYWLPGSTGYDPTYVSTVDQQVAWIKQLGMSVILDLHWTNQAVQSWGCDKQQPMADAWSITFWEQLARRYKNDPVIMFELFNEPYITDWNIWRNGGNTYGFNVVGFQALYNAVRAQGADNVVIINGLNYAYDLSGAGSRLITGYNIVYGTHPYNFAEKMPGDWDRAFGYLAATQPLIATEFGTFDCSSSYIQTFVDYFDARCMSWTAWAWWPGGCGFPSVISNWNGDAVAYGQLLKDSMQKNFKCGSQSSTTKSATTSTSTTKSATTTTATTATTKSATTTTTTGTTKSATTTTTGTTKSSTTTTTTGSSTTGGGSSVVVYDDKVINPPFADWSWASTRNAADSSKKYAGSNSYSFTPSGWGSVYFYRADFFGKSTIKSIDFYFNKGSNSNALVNFNIVEYDGSNSNKIGVDKRVEEYCGVRDSNGWAKCSVSLGTLLANNNGVYDGFWFQDQSNGASQSTVYVDNISVVLN